MRIQHNIMAMNSYRNYNNNASALSKNLEKLSSGYKINRAGDDAAGLAISEKMRAQIKGLEAAQKNVKDGISLVKTAEGAMQEIQDMLSRMKYLATQSSNGTYDDEVDRKALQDEVDQLNSEINRIADSANFNGTKLLDGSLAAGGSSSGSSKVVAPTVSGFSLATVAAGSKASAVADALADAVCNRGSLDISVNVNGKTYNYSFKVAAGTDDKLRVYDGTTAIATAGTALGDINWASATGQCAKVTKGALASKIAEKLNADLASLGLSAEGSSSGKITLKAAEEGKDTLTSFTIGVTWNKVETNGGIAEKGSSIVGSTLTAGKDKIYGITVADLKKSTDASKLNVYSINGKKFALMTDVGEIAKVTDSSINIIQVASGAANAAKIAAEINQMTGLDLAVKANGTTIAILPSEGSAKAGGGLQLQIGDTSDDFNQLMVTVGDLHANAIGVGGVDISSIDGAAASIDKIKDAINTVSAIRGKLGATQNRLEHTQNNLSVMTENIQDAESTIRDTDVADEMMAYTKNNILIQSAQAMLAQANAVPQGVLQLLQ